MKKILAQFWSNQSAATAIEYALVAALLSLIVIASVQSIGGGVEARFDQVDTIVSQ